MTIRREYGLRYPDANGLDCIGSTPQCVCRDQGVLAMLALTRRIGEEVVIGDPKNPTGVIRIVEIHGDKVRLSFGFPRHVKINRRELAEQKARQEEEPQQQTNPDAGLS